MRKASSDSLLGSWVVKDSKVVTDAVGQEIEDRLRKYSRLAKSKDGDWAILYIDRELNEFWELTYPQSHLHGGGPKALSRITEEEANLRYDFSLNGDV